MMLQEVLVFLLQSILDRLEEIDFREKAKLNPNAKLSAYHYYTIIIDEVLRIAQSLRLGLCRRHDFLYLYNGSFWMELDYVLLEDFLGEAAIRSGIELSKSKYYRFKGELLKQFLSQSNLPSRDVHDRVLLNV